MTEGKMEYIVKKNESRWGEPSKKFVKDQKTGLMKIDKKRLAAFRYERMMIRRIQERLEELLSIKDFIREVRYGTDKVQEGSGVQRDVFATRLIQIEEMLEFYDKKLEALLEEERIIEEWLAGIRVSHQAILRAVYFDGLSWDDASKVTGITRKTIDNCIKKHCYFDDRGDKGEQKR
jgi:hypothetical protein